MRTLLLLNYVQGQETSAECLLLFRTVLEDLLFVRLLVVRYTSRNTDYELEILYNQFKFAQKH
jgi:hypothetical protein